MLGYGQTWQRIRHSILDVFQRHCNSLTDNASIYCRAYKIFKEILFLDYLLNIFATFEWDIGHYDCAIIVRIMIADILLNFEAT